MSSDVFGLGVLLAQAASRGELGQADTSLEPGIAEVVRVATAPNPGDRYPDMGAFRAALVDAVGAAPAPAPRRVRRNPYKALAPFDEDDRADFYGRDDAVETLVAGVAAHGLVVLGASGSGKSSVVRAGLIPELRAGALLGSDEWSVVAMVPGIDPFEEFHIAVRSAAEALPAVEVRDRSRELQSPCISPSAAGFTPRPPNGDATSPRPPPKPPRSQSRGRSLAPPVSRALTQHDLEGLTVPHVVMRFVP